MNEANSQPNVLIINCKVCLRLKKGLKLKNLRPFDTGRDGGIRTRDPLHPMQVRYQAALRPEDNKYIRKTFFTQS